MENEYQSIRNYLPPGAASILDIGCGIGGIDIFLSRHYKNCIDIYLIDKTEIDKYVYYRFKKRGSFYNSLVTTKSTLVANGIDDTRIHVQEATNNCDIFVEGRVDFILSFISWGFHYPVSTYLDKVHDKLNIGGRLILDVRKNTGGEKEIEDKFGNCRVICQGKSRIRVLAEKNKAA